MSDKPKNQEGWDGSGAYQGKGMVERDPDTPSSYKANRPKRRRKGQVNDGEWAPGYGPDAKKK